MKQLGLAWPRNPEPLLRLPSGATRGDCESLRGAREAGLCSCAYLNCRHHLVGEQLRMIEPAAVEALAARLDGRGSPDSCALDVADRGTLTQGGMAAVMGTTPQNVSLIEQDARRSLLRIGGTAGRRIL